MKRGKSLILADILFLLRRDKVRERGRERRRERERELGEGEKRKRGQERRRDRKADYSGVYHTFHIIIINIVSTSKHSFNASDRKN